MSPKSLRIRDLGCAPGSLPPGPTNSILDVAGLHISQTTVPTLSATHTNSTSTKGLTVISPRPPKDFYKPCYASTFCFNGNGELTCTRQIADWGYTNTPIAFTNSLSLGTVFDGVWDWVMERQDEMGWEGLTRARHYGTPVVGETADWLINCDVRASRLHRDDIKKCFATLKSKEDGAVVLEGQRGGGAGMTCHQFTGGTGTSSRLVGAGDGSRDEYTLAVLSQTNYGVLSDLVIGGVPVGKILAKDKEAAGYSKEGPDDLHPPNSSEEPASKAKDGSILILIVTDAPLLPHQLNRVARHATAGLAQVGSYGIGRNTSGDIFLAISTAEHGTEQLGSATLGSALDRRTETYQTEVVKNECIDTYFYACAEAVEEAVLNSMVGGRDGTIDMDGKKVEGLPVERVKEILKQYLVKV